MTEHVIELCQDEINTLIHISNKITFDPSINPEQYCKEIKELLKLIPLRIKNTLTQFKKNGSDTGFLLIKGLPVDETILPNTPPGNTYNLGQQTILAKIQSLFISILGEIIAYEAECYGHLFQDIVPIQSMEKMQTSLGSGQELEIHTEQAFSQLRPDILSLSCLRGNSNAFTYILHVNEIIKHMSPSEIDLLRQPLWKTGIDLSFKLNGHEFIEGDIRGPFPIVSGLDIDTDPYLLFDQDLMTGITEESHQMIDKIIDIYYQYRIQCNLKPGEIIFIDNNRAVHGRSPFIPKYDGFDRFLVRCFAVFDYEKSEYARNRRTVLAIYS